MRAFSVFYIIEVLNVVPEILIIAPILSSDFSKKYQSNINYVIWYLVGFIIMSGVAIMVNDPYIRMATTFFFLLITAVFMYTGSVIVKLFSSIYYIMIVFISETLFVGILMLMNYGEPAELLSSNTGRIIGMIGICSCSCCFSIILHGESTC